MKNNVTKQQIAHNSNVVYWVIFLATVFGFIMPAFALLFTLRSVSGLENELSTRLPGTITNTIVSVVEMAPPLYRKGISLGGIPYFAVYVVYNFTCMTLLIVFSQKAKSAISRIMEFYSCNKLVCFTVVFLVVSFQSKMFFGFWFSGIAGWDFSKITTLVLPLAPELDGNAGIGQQLLKGINTDNFITYFEDGCIEGQVILGFSGIDVIGINHGIAGVVFPKPFLEFEDSTLWLDMTNYGLQHHAIGSELLGTLSYPNHSTYLPLKVEDVTSFNKIEVWEVTVCHEGTLCYVSQAALVRSYTHD
jgi:hypothetical protein